MPLKVKDTFRLATHLRNIKESIENAKNDREVKVTKEGTYAITYMSEEQYCELIDNVIEGYFKSNNLTDSMQKRIENYFYK